MGVRHNKEAAVNQNYPKAEPYFSLGLKQIQTKLFPSLREPEHPYLVDLLELEALLGVKIVKITPKAGNGHKKVCYDVTSAIKLPSGNEDTWTAIELDKLLAGKTHSTGSNSRIGKHLTEFLQENSSAQWFFSWLHHELVLRNDSNTILSVARDSLSRAPQHDVTFVAYHPDVAYVMSHFKYHLMREFGKNIQVVVVMTDHLPLRPQFVWYPIDADLILAPDELSAKKASEQLIFWERIMRSRRDSRGISLPKVAVISYPVNPYLLQPLTESEFQNRILQVSPGGNEQAHILVPQGGAIPNPEFQLDFIRALPSSIVPHVILTASDRTTVFAAEARKLGADVVVCEGTLATHAAYLEAHKLINPSMVETKPSEKHNHSLVGTGQRGGEVVLFAPAVGDQEKQNMAWMESINLMPNREDSIRIQNMSVEELKSNIAMAENFRAIMLNKDGKKAAEQLTNLMHSGWIRTMLRGQTKSKVSNTGARDVWVETNDNHKVARIIK